MFQHADGDEVPALCGAAPAKRRVDPAEDIRAVCGLRDEEPLLSDRDADPVREL